MPGQRPGQSISNFNYILEAACSQGKGVLGEDFSMALGGGADADEANFFDRGWR